MGAYLGVDIGGTSVKWALVDDAFNIIDRGDTPTDFSTSEEVVQAIVDIANAHAGSFEAVGVSAPGLIFEDDPDGTIYHGGALTYMHECPIGRILREKLGVPVAVRNDGKACAMGEYAVGALKGTRVGVVMAIGTGIGGGVVIDGNVLHGTHCFAGEFSMMRNDAASPLTIPNTFSDLCGWMGLRRFVLEAKGLVNDPTYAEVDGRTIFEWIDGGDEDARRGLDAYANAFAGRLFNLQCVLDPDVFAIAGGISCHDALIEAIERAIVEQRKAYTGPLDAMPLPRITRATLGNDANLYGAVQEARKLLA